jgi:hypothetical protein
MQMKTFLVTLLFLITASTHAQVKMNKVSINPVQLFGYNRLNMEYERGFSKGKYGIGIYMGQTGNSTRKIHGQYSWLSEQNVVLKFYSKNMEKSSFWYGGKVSVSSGNIYDENGFDKATNIGALGILAMSGYQIVVNSFYVDPYLGAGYSLTNDLFGSAKYTGDISQPSNWLLVYGFKIGICF